MDLQQAFDEGFDALKGYVDRSFDAYARRIKTLEGDVPRLIAEASLVGKEGAPGRDGIDGKDVDPEAVAVLVRLETKGILEGWERPQDGKSVTTEELQPLIAEVTQRAVAALPVPKDGKDGRDGADGKDAELVAPDDIAVSIATAVKMLAHMPDTKDAPPASQLNIHFPAMPELKLPDNVVNVTLPELPAPVINMAAPVVNTAPVNVQVDMPKRGKELTTVTGWDKQGRITTFERQEVDDNG